MKLIIEKSDIEYCKKNCTGHYDSDLLVCCGCPLSSLKDCNCFYYENIRDCIDISNYQEKPIKFKSIDECYGGK